MTTKTDIDLPPLPQSIVALDDCFPTTTSKVLTWGRAAVEAHRLGRMPSDDELLNYAMAIAHERELRVTGHLHDEDRAVRRFRAAVRRYGSSQPAASAEPVGPVRLRDEGSEIYLDGVQCRYSIEQGEPWPYSDTLAYAFDPGIAERIVAALNAAPVAQEPVASDIEQMAATRYRPVPDGLLRYKVVAGDGTRALFHGTKDECRIVARRLTEAFLDGAYIAAQPVVTDEMITRFLGWYLPRDFTQDAGVSSTPPRGPHSWHIGAATFIDLQARAMLEYVLTGVQK